MLQRAFSFPVGQRIGRWSVDGPTRRTGGRYVVPCHCDCGAVRHVDLSMLKAGKSLSCGCRKSEAMAAKAATHGDARVKHRARLYRIWSGMKTRCGNPRAKNYQYYGGDGVRVCDQWQQYQGFRDWAVSAGYEETLTLDRIDPSGHYAPDNCRWVSLDLQHDNRRDTVYLQAFAERKTLSEWAADSRCLATRRMLKDRLRRGWPAELAISTPRTSRWGSPRLRD